MATYTKVHQDTNELTKSQIPGPLNTQQHRITLSPTHFETVPFGHSGTPAIRRKSGVAERT